ncbi:MAG TPA: MurR/RpiR family transcriptional regulator [Candidatus Limnocylindria bacterium]|jgi:DNA-binding MurR/RpiR family transcriptional regulator
MRNAAPGRRRSSPGFAGGVLPRIRSLLPSLSPSDARVARTVLGDPAAAMTATAVALARRAKASPSTVVRCCQRLGFRGYRDLQLTLAGEIRTQPLHHGNIADADTVGTVLLKVFAAAAHTVAEGVRTVDHDRFEKAVKAIADARQVLFVGVGTSAPLAQDAAYRFRTIGVQADAPADVHVQHVASRLLRRGDVCVAITHTGATRETVMTLRAARGVGATTVAVTSFARSAISQVSDIVLVSGGPEQSFRHEAMASRLAHLCLLDALYVAVAMRSQAAARRALNASAEVIASHRNPRPEHRGGSRPTRPAALTTDR